MRAFLLRLALAAASALVALATLEMVVRAFPEMLPPTYRSTFPHSGFELFHPGILSRTHIEEVPLPFRFDSPDDTKGPPPQDLERLGLVEPGSSSDRQRIPAFVLPRDDLGLANEKSLDAADIVIVGDSFAYAAGITSPPGLQSHLTDLVGLSVYNLGIPAIGPTGEAYLLRQVGLAKKPRYVVWLFFGGNDLDDEQKLTRWLEAGVETHADLFPDMKRPPSLLLDLLLVSTADWRGGAAGPSRRAPALPPFEFRSHEGRIPLWFLPQYLRNLTGSKAEWQEHPGWQRTQDQLDRIAGELESHGIELLLVYVPSKPEVYLPHVIADADLFHQMASFGLHKPLSSTPEALWRAANDHRQVLERLLAAFAGKRGIDYLSLAPALERLAADGVLGYLAADTHWGPPAQRAAAEEIAARLAELESAD